MSPSTAWTARRHQRRGTAEAVAHQALSWLAGAQARTVLNVNVPDLPLERLAGVRWAPLANFGQVQAAMREGDGG
ncbi:MAG TPA: hypothetical protein VHF00_08035, partial [Acidimicrobiales bacterium]|nr:hypothetical protein [Acidimicrobiales bacterium]